MKELKGYQHGINLGGWLSQCDHTKERYDTFITETDIARISSWGLDHVRVPVDYQLIETEDGASIEAGYTYIDNCIAWCQKYHLNMILDLHKTAGYAFDEFSTSRDFFHNEALIQRFVNLWIGFAKRYGQYHEFLTFELLNEIVDINVAEQWNDIAKRAIIAIRELAPDINIIIGGVCYNSIFTLDMLDIPYDDKIIYTFHCYDPIVFTHQAAYWVKGMPQDFKLAYPVSIEKILSDSKQFLPPEHVALLKNYKSAEMNQGFFEDLLAPAQKLAEERQVALYCGEYGVIDQADPISVKNWYHDITAAFNAFGIGRAAWSYKEMDFGLVDEHYASVIDELVTLL